MKLTFATTLIPKSGTPAGLPHEYLSNGASEAEYGGDDLEPVAFFEAAPDSSPGFAPIDRMAETKR
jgi:hypothetical protein